MREYEHEMSWCTHGQDWTVSTLRLLTISASTYTETDPPALATYTNKSSSRLASNQFMDNSSTSCQKKKEARNILNFKFASKLPNLDIKWCTVHAWFLWFTLLFISMFDDMKVWKKMTLTSSCQHEDSHHHYFLLLLLEEQHKIIPQYHHDPILVSSGNNTTNAVVSNPSNCTHRLIMNHYHPHLLQYHRYHQLHCYNDKCEVCIANYYQQSIGFTDRRDSQTYNK